MIKYNSYSFAVRVWLTAVVVVPFLQCIINKLTDKLASGSDLEGGLILTILFGLPLSMPSFLLFWLSVHLLNRLSDVPWMLKLFLSFIGLVLALLPFQVLIGKNLPLYLSPDFLWVMLYPLTIVVGVWSYSFKEFTYPTKLPDAVTDL